MFGDNQNDDNQPASVTSIGAPMAPANNNPTDAPAVDPGASPIGDPTPPPDTPLVNGQPTEEPESDTGAEPEKPAADETPTSTPAPANEELLSIKQQALQQLGPLVNHLDQTPEEKFRTTMMMIQANDDQGLVKDAYEAAKQIADEKERAQALLDVVNEINYFTQDKHED